MRKKESEEYMKEKAESKEVNRQEDDFPQMNERINKILFWIQIGAIVSAFLIGIYRVLIDYIHP